MCACLRPLKSGFKTRKRRRARGCAIGDQGRGLDVVNERERASARFVPISPTVSATGPTRFALSRSSSIKLAHSALTQSAREQAEQTGHRVERKLRALKTRVLSLSRASCYATQQRTHGQARIVFINPKMSDSDLRRYAITNVKVQVAR